MVHMELSPKTWKKMRDWTSKEESTISRPTILKIGQREENWKLVENCSHSNSRQEKNS